MSQLTINSFAGMNNYSGRFVDKTQTIEPINIVDAIPTLDGSLEVRKGSELVISLSDCSNLWKSPGTNMILAVVDNHLVEVDLMNLTTNSILTIPSNTDKVYYVNIGNVDFCGNSYWLAAIEHGVARTMGQSINDLQSMNWQKTDNGLVLYLKNADGEETAYAHPGEFAHAPNPMDFLCYGHGVLWGGRDKKVVYSYPGLYEWWEDAENYFEFPTEIRMIYPIANGMFIGLADQVIFLEGTDTSSMQGRTVDWDGVIKGSLVVAPKIADMPVDVPTWMNEDGFIIAGLPDGTVKDITKERVQVTPVSNSAAGVIKIDGVDALLYQIEE